MKRNQKFFVCKHCGNLIGFIDHKGASVICCGGKMAELVPNTVEASTEKHLPVVTVYKNSVKVQVGSVLHPMEEKHYVGFVYLETETGGQRKTIGTDRKPVVRFSLVNDKPVAVYAYCNLHGLWKTAVT